MESTQISSGVTAGFIKANNFKTTAVAISFYTAPKMQDLAANALALNLMKTGCSKYPTARSVNLKLGELYGATLSTTIQKNGDCFEYRISITCLEDQYTYGTNNVSDSVGLLKDLVFEKFLKGEGYSAKVFEQEKRLLCELIASEINEKRIYATNRLVEAVCENEPFGFSKFGSLDEAKSLTPNDVLNATKRLITNSAVNITVIGGAMPENILDEFKDLFEKSGRSYTELPEQILRPAKEKPNILTEAMDITQSKLCIGLRSQNGGSDNTTAPVLVMCDLFGGGPHSKLFLNVREKLSLCYYCSAAAHRRKGVIIISSGVETENIEKAKCEILKQFEAVKSGDFSAEDLARSKRWLIGNLNSIKDDLPSLLNWYCIRSAYSGEVASPEKMCELIEAVTENDVALAAREYSLDTVYTLRPKED